MASSVQAGSRQIPHSADVRLEIPRTDHVEDLLLLLNHPWVAPWLGGTRGRDGVEKAVAEEQNAWCRDGFGPWVMVEAATDRVVARGGIRRAEVLGRPEIELFYAVHPDAWRRGLALQLARRALQLGLAEKGQPSVVVFTLESNTASLGVIDRCGFAFEGQLQHAGLPHVLYRLTRADYLRLARPEGSA